MKILKSLATPTQKKPYEEDHYYKMRSSKGKCRGRSSEDMSSVGPFLHYVMNY
jgi:hypothetical protein